MNFNDYIPYYVEPESNNYEFRFTVFTPVFNAEDTIVKVHMSLMKQTYKDFEWLIINDGSSDNTDAVIKSIIKTSTLNINYINNTQNRHKMWCFMQGVKYAKGQFFLTLDADDECLENALQFFNEEYHLIPEKDKKTIIAVTCNCIDQFGNKVGTDFPHDRYYSTPFELRAIDKVEGEKWGFTKTDALRGLRFKEEFISNGFMPEGIIWNILGDQAGKTKFVNKAMRIYYIGVENSISGSNPEKLALGQTIRFILIFNKYFNRFFFKNPILFLKSLYQMLYYSVHIKSRLKDYLNVLEPVLIKFILFFLWPFRHLIKLP